MQNYTTNEFKNSAIAQSGRTNIKAAMPMIVLTLAAVVTCVVLAVRAIH